MSIFNKHETCFGITLFRLGRWRSELWFCPRGYVIKEHTHPTEEVELIYLFGNAVFHRRNLITKKLDSAAVSQKNIGRRFTIRYFHSHWFEVSDRMLVFMNIQRFHPGCSVVSAAVDFKETEAK